MNTNEVLKLALEAAYLAGWNASGEGYNAEYPFGDNARNPEEDAAWVKDRDNSLREALAQPQPEPVAWMTQARNFVHVMEFTEEEAKLYGWKAVYTSPPAQPQHDSLPNGLTEDETSATASVAGLLRKPAQPQQEPVAWALYQRNLLLSFWMDKGDAYDFEFTSEHRWEPLYTSPPAQEFTCSTGLCHYRKPLTDEQVSAIWKAVPNQALYEAVMVFTRAIEAAHGIKGDA